jgi:hypothetical protein
MSYIVCLQVTLIIYIVGEEMRKKEHTKHCRVVHDPNAKLTHKGC